jgi:hypothetical protein
MFCWAVDYLRLNVCYEIDVYNFSRKKRKAKVLLSMYTDECKTEGAWIIVTQLMVLERLLMGGFVNAINSKNDYKS